jgi:hypothetical protein
MRQIAGANENGPDIGRTRVMGAEGFEPGARKHLYHATTNTYLSMCVPVCVAPGLLNNLRRHGAAPHAVSRTELLERLIVCGKQFRLLAGEIPLHGDEVPISRQ